MNDQHFSQGCSFGCRFCVYNNAEAYGIQWIDYDLSKRRYWGGTLVSLAQIV
ncbi:MAG: hypothetical protein P8R42_27350 [Candidatus Binatia bacterium]|nr:hypothetical protein [Candidatus Binatia bacterium]